MVRIRKEKIINKVSCDVPKGTSPLPLSGVALHFRTEGVKQVPNGTNTYLLEIEKEEGSRSSTKMMERRMAWT